MKTVSGRLVSFGLAILLSVAGVMWPSEGSAALPVATVLPPVPGISATASYFTRNCSANQRTVLQTAANEAKRLLLAGGNPSAFVRWFGTLDTSQATQDKKNAIQFVRVYAAHSLTLLAAGAGIAPTVTIDCAGGLNGPLAHVTGAGTGVIYIDNNFWTLPNNIRDSFQHVSKASTLLHELTHLAGTGDFAVQFGYTDATAFQFALDLARLLPANTIYNAGNHEWFYFNE